MREPMDHERCSELLAPLLRGELDRERAAEVEAHLESCAQCSEERVGLEALVRGEAPLLTELERARLRRVVLSDAVPMPDEGSVAAPFAGSSRGARLYRVLGTAAVLALIGGFAYLGLGGGVGGEDDGASGVTSADADAPDAGGGDEAEASRPVQDSTQAFKQRKDDSRAAAAGSEAATLEAAAPPSPTFELTLGPVDEKRLNKLGRSGLPLVVFSRSYTAADVAEHQSAFIEEVAAQAPTARGEDIRTCAGAVSEEFPNSLLAYAALAEFEDRGDILVLAFAWTDADTGPLEQSMVWAWSIGDCGGIPVHYSKNVIRPRR